MQYEIMVGAYMRLEGITVRGLLNQFNYTIPLHTGTRVTIIAGPNGYGKTTLLRRVDLFYRGSYEQLRTTECVCSYPESVPVRSPSWK